MSAEKINDFKLVTDHHLSIYGGVFCIQVEAEGFVENFESSEARRRKATCCAETLGLVSPTDSPWSPSQTGLQLQFL